MAPSPTTQRARGAEDGEERHGEASCGAHKLHGGESVDAEVEACGRVLWTPTHPEDTLMARFTEEMRSKYAPGVRDFDVRQWALANIGLFWSEIARRALGVDVCVEDVVDADIPIDERPRWFRGLRMNYAQALLAGRPADSEALVAVSEESVAAGTPVYARLTTGELRTQLEAAARSLSARGVGRGDVVAAWTGNAPEAVVLGLAAASLGALYTTLPPDFGASAAIERLGQTRPRVLLAPTGVFYNGRVHDMCSKAAAVCGAVPGMSLVLIPRADWDGACAATHVLWGDFLSAGDACAPFAYAPLPFEHPLYVVYSSGTTGAPKCIVHGAGGTLLQHWKEHALHGDVRPGERMLQYTSVGWMMWHWALGALAAGASLVLYDGSPFRPEPLCLLRLASALRIRVLGVSAKYVQHMQHLAGHAAEPLFPHGLDLSALRLVYSTGSPLSAASFCFFYDAVAGGSARPCTPQLASITGGTDILSLFAGGDPTRAVRAGEIQGACLGMAVGAVDGELVCTLPFPAMPVFFWGDWADGRLVGSPGGDAAGPACGGENGGRFHVPEEQAALAPGRQYRAAYFARVPHAWHHGDFVRITRSGGIVMLGRSDGVLNPAGVRFGSAELYAVVDTHFARRVHDALAVGVRTSAGDEAVVLFLELAGASLETAIEADVRRAIRDALSPRHVPALILACPGIPYTLSGKKMEVAVKRILNGMPSSAAADGAVANPEVLAFYRNLRLSL